MARKETTPADTDISAVDTDTNTAHAKIIIYGLSNTGKTTLLNTLDENSLIISFDGKKFPLSLPHVNLQEFSFVEDFLHCNQ